MSKSASAVFLAVITALVLGVVPAFGQAAVPAPTQQPTDDDKAEARRLFAEGIENVKGRQYGEALVRFERAYALFPYAVTSLNIGVCERALGHYVRAKVALLRALAEHEAGGATALPESSVGDAKGFLTEIDGLLAHATVTISPADATIAVDGRPLAAMASEGPKSFAAGLEPAGKGKPAPAASFELLLDPGNHVFVISKKGFSDAVVNRSAAPGSHSALALELAKLPATIRVSSAAEGAIVRVGKSDVGPVPVDVLRPAGTYPVVVQKEGFVDYETSLSVQAGEEAKIDAVLAPKKLNVANQWWFWTSIAAAAGTVGVVTYFAVRPEPDPPPYDGGSTGWVAKPALFEF